MKKFLVIVFFTCGLNANISDIFRLASVIETYQALKLKEFKGIVEREENERWKEAAREADKAKKQAFDDEQWGKLDLVNKNKILNAITYYENEKAASRKILEEIFSLSPTELFQRFEPTDSVTVTQITFPQSNSFAQHLRDALKKATTNLEIIVDECADKGQSLFYQ